MGGEGNSINTDLEGIGNQIHKIKNESKQAGAGPGQRPFLKCLHGPTFLFFVQIKKKQKGTST